MFQLIFRVKYHSDKKNPILKVSIQSINNKMSHSNYEEINKHLRNINCILFTTILDPSKHICAKYPTQDFINKITYQHLKKRKVIGRIHESKLEIGEARVIAKEERRVGEKREHKVRIGIVWVIQSRWLFHYFISPFHKFCQVILSEFTILPSITPHREILCTWPPLTHPTAIRSSPFSHPTVHIDSVYYFLSFLANKRLCAVSFILGKLLLLTSLFCLFPSLYSPTFSVSLNPKISVESFYII